MRVEFVDGGDVVAGLRPDVGGRVASLTVFGHEILRTAADRPIDWGLFPMVPFAGRIGDGTFEFEGRRVELPRTLPPHAIHGTLVTRPWSIVGEGRMEAALGPPWPWAGSVRHDVTIDGWQVSMRLSLVAEERMPAWLGWHPWFRRALGRGMRATVGFGAEAMYERGDDHLPTGRLVPMTDGPWDDAFSNPTAIGATWGSALRMEVETDCPVLVVFDEPEDAFCLEPQTAPPDAIALGAATMLDPGDTLSATMRLRFSLPTVD